MSNIVVAGCGKLGDDTTNPFWHPSGVFVDYFEEIRLTTMDSELAYKLVSASTCTFWLKFTKLTMKPL